MSEKVEKGRLKKYGKEYGKYAACVVTGFALYGAAEVNRKLGDPALPFQDIIGGIQRFLAPVWDEFLKQREFLATWKAAQASWSIWSPEENTRKTETD